MTSADELVAVHDTDAAANAGLAPAVGDSDVPSVWMLCRKRSNGEFESLRSFDDEARARADLELVQSVSEDEFWLAAVPFVQTKAEVPGQSMSRVQSLALTWLADGAEAEGAAQLDDTVQVRPHHVRGFLSVPPEEWRQMEEKGWVRNGMITPEGAAVIGRNRAAS